MVTPYERHLEELEHPTWNRGLPPTTMEVLVTWNFKEHRIAFLDVTGLWYDANTLEIVNPPSHWAYIPPAPEENV